MPEDVVQEHALIPKLQDIVSSHSRAIERGSRPYKVLFVGETWFLYGSVLWDVLKDEPHIKPHEGDKILFDQSDLPIDHFVRLYHGLLQGDQVTIYATGERYRQAIALQREHPQVDVVDVESLDVSKYKE